MTAIPHNPNTHRDLLRAVKRVFLERVRAVEIRACWKQAAGIEWDEGTEKIGVLWVDPFQRGIEWAVVHELVHYVKRHKMADEGELEEPQVEGLANEFFRLHIEAVPARWWWWRRAIRAKLKGGL